MYVRGLESHSTSNRTQRRFSKAVYCEMSGEVGNFKRLWVVGPIVLLCRSSGYLLLGIPSIEGCSNRCILRTLPRRCLLNIDLFGVWKIKVSLSRIRRSFSSHVSFRELSKDFLILKKRKTCLELMKNGCVDLYDWKVIVYEL